MKKILIFCCCLICLVGCGKKSANCSLKEENIEYSSVSKIDINKDNNTIFLNGSIDFDFTKKIEKMSKKEFNRFMSDKEREININYAREGITHTLKRDGNHLKLEYKINCAKVSVDSLNALNLLDSKMKNGDDYSIEDIEKELENTKYECK